MNKWRSPREKPSPKVPVLGTLVDETEKPWVWPIEYVYGQWLEVSGGTPEGKVIAWMPMPPPWTGPDFDEQ